MQKIKRLVGMPSSELVFRLEQVVVRSFYCWLRLRPSSAPFLSGDSYRSLATLTYEGGELLLQSREVIFCSAYRLEEFMGNLHSVVERFTLISHHSDITVDSRYLPLANHPSLIRWYAQNSILRHSKVTPIPIGLEDRWRHNAGVVSHFLLLRGVEVTKVPRILCSFSVRTNPSVRTKALESLRKIRFVDHFHGNSRDYREHLVNYMFVVSPRGNGIDCHRAWEAIYLNVVPVVTDVDFYVQFREFMPVFMIDSWTDLENYDEESLTKVYWQEIEKLKTAREIWLEYWKGQVEKVSLS